jgi:hypothetical protein
MAPKISSVYYVHYFTIWNKTSIPNYLYELRRPRIHWLVVYII